MYHPVFQLYDCIRGVNPNLFWGDEILSAGNWQTHSHGSLRLEGRNRGWRPTAGGEWGVLGEGAASPVPPARAQGVWRSAVSSLSGVPRSQTHSGHRRAPKRLNITLRGEKILSPRYWHLGGGGDRPPPPGSTPLDCTWLLRTLADTMTETHAASTQASMQRAHAVQ